MNAAHIPMHRKWLAAGLVGLVVLAGSAVSQQAFAQTLIDYDTDNDNLIEVSNLDQLNAIRYDLNGDGMSGNTNYAAAFPDPETSMGCPATCTGYELMADLNFDDNSGAGWQPIGTDANRFTAEFHGNGHTISNLFINRTTDEVGLFGVIGSGAVIRNVGLVGVDVTGNDFTGGLAGRIFGTINASYVTGMVDGDVFVGCLVGVDAGTINASYATCSESSGFLDVGGLVGLNSGGSIRASYATGVVSGRNTGVGGLVGDNASSGIIRASYATGEVSGIGFVGGLAGGNAGSIHDSYFDNTSGQTGTGGRSTSALQSPTTYTGIYANWNVDVDNADNDGDPLTNGDDPWDFGTSAQYPVLQVDFNGDGVKSWEEFGLQQSRPGVFASPGALSLMEGTTGAYTIVLLTMPTTSVTVTPESANTAAVRVDSGALMFTPENWNTAQTVTIRAVDDDDGFNEVVSLMHTVVGTGNYASVTARDVTVSVADPDPGVFVSSGSLSLMEGEAGSYTVVLLSAPTNDSVRVRPDSRNTTSVSVSVNGGDTLTFTTGNWNMEQTVTVRAVHDMNTANEVVMLTHTVDSTDSDYSSATASDVIVNVTDNGAGIAVSPGSLSLMEGTTGAYTAALLSAPTTSVTVTPVSGTPRQVSVSGGGELTFMPDDWNAAQTVTVRAEDDDDTDNERVSLTHTVASGDPNYNTQVIAPVVTVNVEDDDDGIRVRVRVFLEGPLR